MSDNTKRVLIIVLLAGSALLAVVGAGLVTFAWLQG